MIRITAVTTSVAYADIQRHTLPSLVQFADRTIVVTAPGDDAVSLAIDCGAEVIVTTKANERGAIFNKSGMVRMGQLACDTTPDDWTLIVDADTLIDPSFRFACNHCITNRMTLYSCKRYTTRTQEDFASRRISDSDSTVGLGYFQLYNPHARGNPLYDDWSYAADACDMTFKARFDELVVLPFSVIHLGPTGTNWFGRVSPRWRD